MQTVNEHSVANGCGVEGGLDKLRTCELRRVRPRIHAVLVDVQGLHGCSLMTFNGVVRLNCAAGNGRPFAVRCLESGNATLQLQRSQRLNWGIDGTQNGLLIVQQHARRRRAGLRHHSRDPDGYAFAHNQLGCVHAHSRAEDPRLTIEGKLRSGCVGLGSWPDVDTIDEHGRESIRTPVPSLTPKTKDARDVIGPRRKGLAASVVGWHPAHIAMNTAPMHTRASSKFLMSKAA